MADAAALPYQEIIQYGGMLIGAGVAAFLLKLGWSKVPTKDTEVAISGQAHIVDTSPLRELMKNIDLLTLQLQKAGVQDERRTVALETLAEVMTAYLKVQAERQEQQDLEAKIRSELRREMDSHGEEPATQPARKR